MNHIVHILCYKCNDVVGEVFRKRKPKIPTIKSRKLCVKCREEYVILMKERERTEERRKFQSDRMKSNNPMFNEEYVFKMFKTTTGKDISFDEYKKYVEERDKEYNRIKETPGERSNRMKFENPMFNEKTVEKQKTTVKSKIESGIICYKRGPDHHLWKGNKDFNNSCRRDLYPVWTFPVLKRDKFMCAFCDSTNNLQVHHLKPLRYFIKEVKEKYGIKNFTNMSAEEIQPLVNEVVSAHKLKDGITICPKCHDFIDPLYFDKNRRGKDEN